MKLQSEYKTIAYFYRNEKGESCRRYLDIKARGCEATHPELIILMLNPGGCRDDEMPEMEREIEVKPDSSLHRVQLFMKKMMLSWVRVLNLSDLQEKSSNLFLKRLKLIERNTLPEHSIFHPARNEELQKHARLETPFLLAWGQDKRKEGMANTVVKRIKEQGYPIINEQGPHFHPLARPGMGLPLWTDYANNMYTQFLKSKLKEDLAEPVFSSSPTEETQVRQRLNLVDKITAAFKFFNNFEYGHPIITSAKEQGRWELFARLLRESGSRPFVGTPDYDYVFADRVENASALFSLLKQHNGKKIIIDAVACPGILTMERGVVLLEAAMCMSPDTGEQWKMAQGYNVDDKRPFRFTGKLALLLGMSKDELIADNRLNKLLEDGVVV
jgi:hypothetical protein